jgi:hypothetical protein
MGDLDTLRIHNLYSCVFNEGYYNKSLCEEFWKDGKFDEEVREKLLSIAKDFYRHIKLPAPIRDIQLTGSLANYNYTKYSDLDVHIIIDFKDINEDTELVKKAVDGMRFIWNVNHDIVINGHDVEVYIQDEHEQHTASGLYSLAKNDWIRKPVYSPPDVDERDVDMKYKYYVKEIAKMGKLLDIKGLSSEEFEAIHTRATKLKEKIANNRKECLSKEGEFCVENLVFKKLRNTGEMEKLIDITNKSYDKIYSDK